MTSYAGMYSKNANYQVTMYALRLPFVCRRVEAQRGSQAASFDDKYLLPPMLEMCIKLLVWLLLVAL